MCLGISSELQLRDAAATPPVFTVGQGGAELGGCPVLQTETMLGAVSVVITGLSQRSQGSRNTLPPEC